MSTLTSNATKRQQFRQLSVLIGLNFVDMLGFAMVFPLEATWIPLPVLLFWI